MLIINQLIACVLLICVKYYALFCAFSCVLADEFGLFSSFFLQFVVSVLIYKQGVRRVECLATSFCWGDRNESPVPILGFRCKKNGLFLVFMQKNSNFVCYERGAGWQLPSLMRFLFDLKYDANEIQNFPLVGGVCAGCLLCACRPTNHQSGSAVVVVRRLQKIPIPIGTGICLCHCGAAG